MTTDEVLGYLRAPASGMAFSMPGYNTVRYGKGDLGEERGGRREVVLSPGLP